MPAQEELDECVELEVVIQTAGQIDAEPWIGEAQLVPA